MAYPAYIRARARELRTKNHLSLDELAKHLALPKTTVYYWIKDLPLGRERRESPHNGTRAMQAKYRRLREAAYEQGRAEYDELVAVPTFRDFVVLYIAEGYKRNRNRVSIGNSDPRMVEMATGWLRRLSSKPTLLCRPVPRDQNLEKLGRSGARRLEIDGCADSTPAEVQQRQASKVARGDLSTESLTVCVNDTALRARLQAWIDRVRDDWH